MILRNALRLRGSLDLSKYHNINSITSSLLHQQKFVRQASTYSDDKTTHFGFKNVGEKEKKEAVLSVFHSVADSYDLMNDAMSLGIHRVWKDAFMKKLDPGPNTKLLDVAGGTGDISFRFLDYVGKEAVNKDDGASVTVFDINASMLKVGEARASELGHTKGISFVQGDAQELPFEDNTFDCYTIAFGIRNVVKIDEALKEAHRVLKPGGRFMCLEFSKVKPQELESLYDLYSFQVIPPMGKILAGDWDSYQYLVESIRKFPDQDTFAEMIREAGFSFVTYEDYTFGVAAVHSGFKL
eukprot:TRINITY_DN1582_c0_g1_i16.p1 TRINITY_DN1582_c0_g1~~TRINITY_DN1582_c0_g1_i16.p1  ORF type:complete len:297 (+),score=20.03 TRINITY_DN1582_c0_g1_i16:31-921(+)